MQYLISLLLFLTTSHGTSLYKIHQKLALMNRPLHQPFKIMNIGGNISYDIQETSLSFLCVNYKKVLGSMPRNFLTIFLLGVF